MSAKPHTWQPGRNLGTLRSHKPHIEHSERQNAAWAQYFDERLYRLNL